MSEDTVVVRRARAADEPARAALLRDAYCSLTWDAFLYFFFHEATLQGTVLGCAALFIFFGAGWGCLGAVPAGAALVLAGARLAHEAAAARAVGALRAEDAGWVAERRGPPRLLVAERRGPPRAPGAPRLLLDDGAAPGRGALLATVSLAACRDAAGGWLGALGVARPWRRRGLARALLAAARAGAARARHPALHALVSALQPAARELLHDAGWEVSGAYARPLLGAALVLPLVRLELDLTPA